LKVFLNLLALSLITGPTGTSNESFGAWIASTSQAFDPYMVGLLNHPNKRERYV